MASIFKKFFKSPEESKKKKKKGKFDYFSEQAVLRLSSIRYSQYSIQGEGPKKHDCQDYPLTYDPQVKEFKFFAVFDGHGASGKEASNAAGENMNKYLQDHKDKITKFKTPKEKEQFLVSMFKSTEKKLKTSGIDYQNSGTCCISVFIQDNICTISNLGDSRAVLCRMNEKDKYAIELSWDHKPSRRDEKYRIKKHGGKIERLNYNGEWVGPLRVWADEEGPGIAMTRTIGDFQAKKIGLISTPEIEHLEIIPYDKFIVIASDGIWDVMTSAEVVGFVLQLPELDPIDMYAQKLVEEARGRWQELNKVKKNNNKIGDYPSARHGIDDITCIIAFLDFTSSDQNEVAFEDERLKRKDEKNSRKEGSKDKKKKSSKNSLPKNSQSQPPPSQKEKENDKKSELRSNASSAQKSKVTKSELKK